MSTPRSSRPSDFYAGLLPVEPSNDPPPICPTTLDNDPIPNGQPPLRKRAGRALSRFLRTFTIGVAATLAWQSYGDAARQMIANSYPLLGWFAPRAEPVAQRPPNMTTLGAPAAPSLDQQQLNAMSLNIDAMRQSVDQVAAGHEQIMRSIDQIAIRITADHKQTTRSADPTATSITVGQEQTTPSADPTATNSDPRAQASGITIESRPGGASLQPTARLDIKTAEARPPLTSSETGTQPSAASGYDRSCFPSASAVLEHHQGASWTLKAPGHEGTMCWYASARPRARGPSTREIVGTTENRLSAPPYPRAPE